ncbi:MAG TPA: hypothetical protein DCL21_02470 [Alphaproteobacteria bacterium]|nr:hypothetical protein [Alphaproteobacteria bacterium]
MKFSKGAMFGLDARIALAIFGALSVISGAALYSAIQQSKATAILTELREIGKAWEQYYLDTGNDISDDINANKVDLPTSYLIEDSGVSGWSGPYLSYEKHNTQSLLHPAYDYVGLRALTGDVAWSATVAPWSHAPIQCTSSNQCSIWALIDYIPNEALIKAIDDTVDNDSNLLLGNFRAYKSTSGASENKWAVFLNIAPIKNPN